MNSFIKKLIIGLLFIVGKLEVTYGNEVVYDNASIFTSEQKSALIKLLLDYEKYSTNQIVILTEQKIDPNYTIEEYAVTKFQEWGIGDKKKDNGLLIVFALKDRKIRTEVGYGLEGEITDAFSSINNRENGLPFFRNGLYGRGLLNVTEGIIQKLSPNFTWENIENMFDIQKEIEPSRFPKKPEVIPHVIDLNNGLGDEYKASLEKKLKALKQETGVPFHVLFTYDPTHDINYFQGLEIAWGFPTNYDNGKQHLGVLIHLNMSEETDVVYCNPKYFDWVYFDEFNELQKTQFYGGIHETLDDQILGYAHGLIEIESQNFWNYTLGIVAIILLILLIVLIGFIISSRGNKTATDSRYGSNNSNSNNSSSDSGSTYDSDNSEGGSSFGGGSSGGGGSTDSW